MMTTLEALPNDILCEILGRTNAETVVRFACSGDFFARAVRVNRAGILACRQSQRSWDHDRVLADSRVLFPNDAHESRAVYDERNALLCGHLTCWTAEGATDRPTDVTLDFNFGISDRIIERHPGDVLTAIWVPVMAERVRVIIGGEMVVDLRCSLLRALCQSDAHVVNLLPLTVGCGFPICALHGHNAVLIVDGACRVRLSYASFPLQSPLLRQAYRKMYNCSVFEIVTTHHDIEFEAGVWHVLRTRSLLLHAILIVVTKRGGNIAEDVLRNVSVRSASCEKTWNAVCLRAERWVGMWQGGMMRGYVLPIITTHDFIKSSGDLQVKLDLLDGIDSASLSVTFAHVAYNRMVMSSGMAGLRYKLPSFGQ